MSICVFNIGNGELLVILFVVALYMVPIIVVCWALRTLWRLHKDQAAILGRLEAIEELLRSRGN
jgi:hypothetical protein